MERCPQISARPARLGAFAFVGVALAALVVLVPSGSAVGCSCVGYDDDEAFEQADAVFIGALVGVSMPPGRPEGSIEITRHEFAVESVFTGEVAARQTVVSARHGASCGLELSGEGPYLVFARTESDGLVGGAGDGELYSNLCSGTRLLTAAAVPVSFGEGRAPGPAAIGPAAPGDSRSQDAVVWLGVGAGVVAAAALVALVVDRRRPSHPVS